MYGALELCVQCPVRFAMNAVIVSFLFWLWSAASSPTVEGAEAGPVDSLRDDAGSSCETHLIIH